MKRTTKTFIGGLVIGAIIGGFIEAFYIAQIMGIN